MGDDITGGDELRIRQDPDDFLVLQRAAQLTDEDEYWDVVNELQRKGGQSILEQAGRLTNSDDASLRRLGCDILGQIGYSDGFPFRATTLPILIDCLTCELDSTVVASAIRALGHHGLPDPLDLVVPHAQSPDASVRVAVAHALPTICGIGWLTSTHPGVVALMKLTTDEDSTVRDWATFGLGTQLGVDGPIIRDCLLARLEDTDADTRAEAMVALARRHDPRIIAHVREALMGGIVTKSAVESAGYLRDPSLMEALSALKPSLDLDPELLHEALRRCNPTADQGSDASAPAYLVRDQFGNLEL
jgi:hypothetical protein